MWRPKDAIKHKVVETSWPTAAEATASRCFSPIRLGSIELETRTWVPAMVPWRATEDGFVTDNVIEWYARFAAGRPGAIVVEATGVRDIPSGPLLRIGHDRFLDGLKRLVDAVRKASDGHTRLLIQIIDFLSVRRRPPKAKYFARYFKPANRHRTRLAKVAAQASIDVNALEDDDLRTLLTDQPDEILAQVLDMRELEALNYGYREWVTDVHLPHIASLPRVLPDIFASAAVRAAVAGFDGVELHYAHAYTMASFLSAKNTRTDGYGNTIEGRLRLPLEVFDAVRDRVGSDYTVGCRYLSDEIFTGGSTLQDAIQIGRAFADAGMDFLSLSRGGKFEDAKQPPVGWAVYPYTGQSGWECMPSIRGDARGPFGRNVPAVAQIRAAIRRDGHLTPIVVAGGIATYELAESILQNGEADIVGAARQSLADPDWFHKTRMGLGREIRRCEFTNYCEGLDQKHKQVTCKLWDRVALDEADIAMALDGRRRLVAPGWTAQRSSDDGACDGADDRSDGRPADRPKPNR